MGSRIAIDHHRSPVFTSALSDSVSPAKKSCSSVLQDLLVFPYLWADVWRGHLHPLWQLYTLYLPGMNWNLLNLTLLPRYFEIQRKSPLFCNTRILVSTLPCLTRADTSDYHCAALCELQTSSSRREHHGFRMVRSFEWLRSTLMIFDVYDLLTWSSSLWKCLAIYRQIFKVTESWHFRPKLWQAEGFLVWKEAKQPSICGLLHFGGTDYLKVFPHGS